MNLISTLKESLILLKTQPKAFIPKLITTTLYSFYTLWAASLAARIYIIPGALGSDTSSLLRETFFLFFFAVVLYFIDLVSYAMYPSIVAAYYRKEPIKLRLSLLEALRAWKVIIILGLVIQFFLFIILLAVALAQIAALAYSMPALIAVAIMLILLSILLFSILVFFVIPVAVVEKKGLMSSFGESISLGLKHKKDLLNVNVVFLLLALATLAVGAVSGFTGLAGLLAASGFALVRLIQAIVYTYVCVVNPYLYLKIKASN